MHNVTCMDQKLLRECLMLQSEVQAVTITKTIRKGKRLLKFIKSNRFNNARIKQIARTSTHHQTTDSWLLEAVQQLVTQDLTPPCRGLSQKSVHVLPPLQHHSLLKRQAVVREPY